MLIDQLPVLADPNGEEEIPIERGTSLYKIKLKNLPTRPPYKPVLKDDSMVNPVGRDDEGKLYIAPVSQPQVERAVSDWLATHTLTGLVFSVNGKNLTLTPMD